MRGQLETAEHLAELVIEHSPAALAMFDREMRYLAVSRSWLRDYGLDGSDILGKSHYAIFPEIPEKWREFHRRALEGEVLCADEDPFVRADGSVQWLKWEVRPWHSADGRVGGAFIFSEDITRQKTVELDLRRKSEEIEQILKVVPAAVWIAKERECNFISGNDLAARIFEQEAGGNFSPENGVRRFFSPEGRELSISELPMQMAASNNVEIMSSEIEVRLPSGKRIFILGNAIPLRDESGRSRGSVAAFLDITEIKKAEADLRVAATAIESLEGIFITDADLRIIRVNRAFTSITGYSPEEALGRKPDLVSPSLDGVLAKAVVEMGKWHGEIRGMNSSGISIPMLLTVTAVKDGAGKTVNYVYNFTDISSTKRAEQEIAHLAFHDHLTGLPNRRLAMDRLEHALTTGLRNRCHCALLMIDLDNFKTLNDSLGHIMGDEILKQVADRLAGSVRDVDTVSRFGGDEFIILLEGLSEHPEEATEQVGSIGDKLFEAFAQPFRLGLQEIRMTCSIGASLSSSQGDTRDALIQQADIALYQAKKDGRDTLRFFDRRMQESIEASAALERELGKALIERQFQLYYQVQVDLAGRPTGAEALLRWRHDERGFVHPGEFIPIAEEANLIPEIGKWVLDAACSSLSAWKSCPNAARLVLSVNVSAKQLRKQSFVEEVRNAVARHQIDPSRLKLELTESVLLEDSEDIMCRLASLKEIGVSLCLDDFGTGYSSLSYLKRLPLDQLKIDQSFVRDIAVDANDRAIVQTIIAMARGLGLDVIAEGVESEEQLIFLIEKGCLGFQGHLFGKPVPIERFENALKESFSRSAKGSFG